MAAKRKFQNHFGSGSSRWTAYVAASAATALAGASTAEGHIHYSGPINVELNGSSRGFVRATFPLESGVNLYATQVIPTPNHENDFVLFGFHYHGITNSVCAQFSNVSRLDKREPVSFGNFAFMATYGVLARGTQYTGSFWRDPGLGYVGFRFNTGGGFQYGWARIKTTGANRNAIIVKDYAWGDVGDRILTGQTGDGENQMEVASSGSLGLLALGAEGLVAWREARNQTFCVQD